MRGVENAECGKCGVWKMGNVCVEKGSTRVRWKMWSAECGKCGVCKMQGKFQFSVSLSHSNADKHCVNNKKN